MAKPRIPEDNDLRELRRLAQIAQVNATVADPSVFPQVFSNMGIRQRPDPPYEYLGMTTTRPDENSAVFAFSYLNSDDGAPREDAFLFEAHRPALTHYPGTSLERLFRQYGGHHRGPKDYFIPPTGSTRASGRASNASRAARPRSMASTSRCP